MKVKTMLDTLNLVKPGIAVNEQLESLSYFYFTGEEVIAYNDKIAISHKLKTPFSTFIKAKELLLMLTKLKAEDIEFTQSESSLKIVAGKFKASLATINDNVFVKKIKKINKSIKNTKFKTLPEELADKLALCHFTASKNEAEGTLVCVRVVKNAVMATDAKRLSYAKLNKPSDLEYFVQADIIPQLLNISPTEIGLGKSWIHFKNKDGCIFSVREIRGTFPDVGGLLSIDGPTIDLPTELTEGLDLLTIFADDIMPAVELHVTKNKSELTVKNEKGKASYSAKIKYSGDDFSIGINPEFFKEMLKHSTSMTIGEKLALIEVENFKLVTALLNRNE